MAVRTRPDGASTFHLIKQLHGTLDIIKQREIIPFPDPLHSKLDYIYTIGQDAQGLS